MSVQGLWVVGSEFISEFTIAFFYGLFGCSHIFDSTLSTCDDVNSVFTLAIHGVFNEECFS